jgi:branched-subunit amino acid transport protein
MTAWTVFLAIGAGTYALRASMFVLLGERSLPAWTETPLALVAPTAIAALVASMLFTHDGRQQLASAPELLAVAGAFVVTRRTGNVLHAIAIGLPVFWIATAVVG